MTADEDEREEIFQRIVRIINKYLIVMPRDDGNLFLALTKNNKAQILFGTGDKDEMKWVTSNIVAVLSSVVYEGMLAGGAMGAKGFDFKNCDIKLSEMKNPPNQNEPWANSDEDDFNKSFNELTEHDKADKKDETPKELPEVLKNRISKYLGDDKLESSL